LEIVETLDYLTGKSREARLDQIVRALAVDMLIAAQLTTEQGEAQELVSKALDSGRAAEIFEQMVSALGGPNDILSMSASYLPKAQVIKPVPALQTGFISAMATREIGLAVVELGGGRTAPGQTIDFSVGFNQVLAMGSEITAQQPLAFVHASSEAQAEIAIKQYQQAITITQGKPELSPVVYERITS
jgi:thymidine phosphorylase